jgi:hypothetical protein
VEEPCRERPGFCLSTIGNYPGANDYFLVIGMVIERGRENADSANFTPQRVIYSNGRIGSVQA